MGQEGHTRQRDLQDQFGPEYPVIKGDAAEDRPNIFRYFSNVPVPIEVLTNDGLGNDGPILVRGACVVIQGAHFRMEQRRKKKGVSERTLVGIGIRD